jgi:Holliday junction resolvase
MNASKDKGTRFESSIVELFRDTGWPHVERRAQRGSNDGGDIAGLPGIVIECKNVDRITLTEWWKECAAEVANAKADMGAVVFKRRKTTNPGDQWVLMDASTFVWLLAQAGR